MSASDKIPSSIASATSAWYFFGVSFCGGAGFGFSTFGGAGFGGFAFGRDDSSKTASDWPGASDRYRLTILYSVDAAGSAVAVVAALLTAGAVLGARTAKLPSRWCKLFVLPLPALALLALPPLPRPVAGLLPRFV